MVVCMCIEQGHPYKQPSNLALRIAPTFSLSLSLHCATHKLFSQTNNRDNTQQMQKQQSNVNVHARVSTSHKDRGVLESASKQVLQCRRL
jgi:hypothetical protein